MAGYRRKEKRARISELASARLASHFVAFAVAAHALAVFALKSIQSNCDYKRKPAFIKVSGRLQKSIYFIAQNAY
jgi:hypothetical protein